jgi:hypothetical protein
MGKRPAIRCILRRSISGRYLSWRSVTIPWRSIPVIVPPARNPWKLQYFLRCGRCGRYFTRFFQQDERRCLLRRSVASTRGPQSRLKRLSSRGAGTRRTWGLTSCCEPSKRLLRTPRSGRPGLSKTTGGRNSCYPSPPDSFRRAKGRGCGEMNLYGR